MSGRSILQWLAQVEAPEDPTHVLKGTGWVAGGGADLSAVWPVGAVFISVDPTNPATTLGFGTWEVFGTGRVLVGFDAGQTEFDTVEKTGGAKSHTLGTAELPAHSHGVTDPGHTHTQNAHTHVQDAHAHAVTDPTHNHTQNAHNHAVTDGGHTHAGRGINSGTAGTAGHQGASGSNNANTTTSATQSATTGISINNATATNQAASTGLTVNNATATNQNATATNQTNTTGITTNDAGSGGAHNNLQPYIVVHMFKRTA